MQTLKRAIGYAIAGAIVGAVLGVILYKFLHFVYVFLGLPPAAIGSPRTIAFGGCLLGAVLGFAQSFIDDD